MKFQLNRLPAKRACPIGPSGLNSIRSCSNYHSSYPRAFLFFLSFSLSFFFSPLFFLSPPPLGFFNRDLATTRQAETKFRREPDEEPISRPENLYHSGRGCTTIDIATLDSFVCAS